MARYRRSSFGRRSRVNRGPSRFGGSRLAGGRSLEWVGLNACSLLAAAPAVTFTDADGREYNAFAMAPASGSLKGTHTLERIRGDIFVYSLTSGNLLADGCMLWQSIQIVELRLDVATLTADTCVNFSQLDMDSHRIVHSALIPHIALLDGATLFTLQGARRSDGTTGGNIDVKVRRRIDFSQFALVHVMCHQDMSEIRVGLHMRGLFRASGAL